MLPVPAAPFPFPKEGRHKGVGAEPAPCQGVHKGLTTLYPPKIRWWLWTDLSHTVWLNFGKRMCMYFEGIFWKRGHASREFLLQKLLTWGVSISASVGTNEKWWLTQTKQRILTVTYSQRLQYLWRCEPDALRNLPALPPSWTLQHPDCTGNTYTTHWSSPAHRT